MSRYGSLAALASTAAVLTAGLAACDGGGGSAAGPTAEAIAAGTARAAAVASALEAAKATLAGGRFDDSAHRVAPVVTAAHDGTTAAIEVSEAGTPQGGSARSGAFAEEDDGPAAIAGWTGARFARGEAGEHLIVYTAVGAPVAAAFTPENLNRLAQVSGLSGEALPEAGLAIVPAYHPLVVSTSLPAASPNGTAMHVAQGTGQDAGLTFTGTFGGGTGTYTCSGGACSVTLDDGGVATAMAGNWRFSPASGTMVQIPDHEHLHFGWWLTGAEDSPYGFQSFAGGTGYVAGSGTVSASMTGSVTYRGAAAGVYASTDIAGGQVTRAESGEFTAEARLVAHFFGAQDAGEITGTLASFRDAAGAAMAGWRVTLEAAALSAGSASFSGTSGGTVGPGTSGSGSWEGRFHGSDGAQSNARPSDVTGRFDVHLRGMHIAGAFGAGSR